MSVEIGNLVKCCKTVRKLAFEKTCSTLMTLKVIEVHQEWRYSIGHISLPLVICSNTLRPFQDITTFIVYMTACNLEKSLSFDNAI